MTVTRWVPSRKAALIDQIDNGVLTLAEAQRQFGLSEEELAEWKRALAAHGVPGLRVTRLQIYKERGRERPVWQVGVSSSPRATAAGTPIPMTY